MEEDERAQTPEQRFKEKAEVNSTPYPTRNVGAKYDFKKEKKIACNDVTSAVWGQKNKAGPRQVSRTPENSQQGKTQK